MKYQFKNNEINISIYIIQLIYKVANVVQLMVFISIKFY